MFNVLAFDLDTRINIISPLISDAVLYSRPCMFHPCLSLVFSINKLLHDASSSCNPQYPNILFGSYRYGGMRYEFWGQSQIGVSQRQTINV